MALKKEGINVSIPNEILPLLEDLAHGNSVDDNVKISLAIELFLGKTVSLARAAEIAEVSLNDFVQILKDKDIHWGEYEEDDMKRDSSFIKDFLRELGEDNEQSCL